MLLYTKLKNPNSQGKHKESRTTWKLTSHSDVKLGHGLEEVDTLHCRHEDQGH